MSQTSAHKSQPDSWVVAQPPEESTSGFFLKLKSSEWTLRILTCMVSGGCVASESQWWVWVARWATVSEVTLWKMWAVAVTPLLQWPRKEMCTSWSLYVSAAGSCERLGERRSAPCCPPGWTSGMSLVAMTETGWKWRIILDSYLFLLRIYPLIS